MEGNRMMTKDKLRQVGIKWDEQGFTIIEALIGIAIFSIGLLAIATLTISTINGNAAARRVTESSAWATDRIERLMAVDYEDLESSPAPIREGAYTISWDVTDNAPLANVKTVRVIVENAQNRPRNITFEYYKAITY
jgi:prepilin-type N-terminal cleavage/methylation domain-containing protein